MQRSVYKKCAGKDRLRQAVKYPWVKGFAGMHKLRGFGPTSGLS
jgi:hypothetical protein